jgi:hypothetical protein
VKERRENAFLSHTIRNLGHSLTNSKSTNIYDSAKILTRLHSNCFCKMSGCGSISSIEILKTHYICQSIFFRQRGALKVNDFLFIPCIMVGMEITGPTSLQTLASILLSLFDFVRISLESTWCLIISSDHRTTTSLESYIQQFTWEN